MLASTLDISSKPRFFFFFCDVGGTLVLGTATFSSWPFSSFSSSSATSSTFITTSTLSSFGFF